MSIVSLLQKIKEGGNNAPPETSSSAFKVLGSSSAVSATDHSQMLLCRNLFLALSDLYHALDTQYDPVIVQNDSLAVLEELCLGRKVILTKNYQSLLCAVYGIVARQCAGYVVRNVVSSMLGVLNHKQSSAHGKECALSVLALLLSLRLNDCVSQATEVVTHVVSKSARANEAIVRVASLQCLLALAKAEHGRVNDLFPEIAKLLPRTLVDRNADVRRLTAELCEAMATFSDGFTAISADSILPALNKAVDEEHAPTQLAVVQAIAAVHEVQMCAYAEKQEQAKIGAARGGSDASSSSAAPGGSSAAAASGSAGNASGSSSGSGSSTGSVMRLSSLKLLSLRRVVVEEHADLRSVLEKIMRTMLSSLSSSSAASVSLTQRIAPHLFVLGEVLSRAIERELLVSEEDLIFALRLLLSIPQRSSEGNTNPNNTLSFEEETMLRVRLSYIIRHYLVARVSETRQTVIARELAQFASDIDSNTRGDVEMTLSLCELNHALTVLGAAGNAVFNEARTAAAANLSHRCFGVRSAAASVLLSLSLISPGAAVEFVETATQIVSRQIAELLVWDESNGDELDMTANNNRNSVSFGEKEMEAELESDNLGNEAISIEDTPVTPSSIYAARNNLSNSSNTSGSNTSGNNNSAKDAERLQRMFFFHGQTLVLSLIIKNVRSLPCGLPQTLIEGVFDAGLQMLNTDVQQTPRPLKHVACSIVRAGGLIVSSCLAMGYEHAQVRFADMLTVCARIIRLGEREKERASLSHSPATTPSQTSNKTMSANTSTGSATVPAPPSLSLPPPQPVPLSVRVDELLFEMMSTEAALLCFTALLLHCSEALLLEPHCLSCVVDALESCLKALKTRYQPILKQHFRCRTLHVTLLETFTLLPAGVYPHSSQQMYMEALRVLRDSIANGVSCSPATLRDVEYSQYTQDLQETLSFFPLFTSECDAHSVERESLLVLKLEQYAVSLQRKESEAFLSLFGKDHHSVAMLTRSLDRPLFNTHLHTDTQQTHTSPNTHPHAHTHSGVISSSSCQIDSRTLDAGLKLLGVTFAHQSSEYQEKAVQLCAQAITQLTQTSSSTSTSSVGGSTSASMHTQAQSQTGRMSLSSTAKSMSVSGLFYGNDEERKKREKRQTVTLRTVVCALRSMVSHLPAHRHSGALDERDLPWRSSVVEMAFSLLTASDVLTRHTAAATMALFAKKWRGAAGVNIIATCCARMRGAIVVALEKKHEASMLINDYAGYISALGYLWIHSGESPETRSLISTTLFDSLRKSDSSMTFQAHVFASLSMLCKAMLDHFDREPEVALTAREDAQDLVEKSVHVTQLACSNVLNANVDEHVFFVESLSRLANASCALCIAFNLSPQTTQSTLTQWKLVRVLMTHGVCMALSEARASRVVRTHLEALPLVARYDREGVALSVLYACVREYLDSAELVRTCSSHSLNAIVDVLHSVVLCGQYDELDMLAYLFRLLDTCFAKLTECALLAQPSLEVKHPLVSVQNVYANMALCIDKLYALLLRIVERDLSLSSHTQGASDNKLVFWVIYGRALALGLNSNNNTSAPLSTSAERENEREEERDAEAEAATHTNSQRTHTHTAAQERMLYEVASPAQYVQFFREYVTRRTPYLAHTRLAVKQAALRLVTHAVALSLQRCSQAQLRVQCDLRIARSVVQNALSQLISSSHTQPHAQTTVSKREPHRESSASVSVGVSASALLSLSHIPLVLFLQDTVSLCCACATLTLGDAPLLVFQSEAMHLLSLLLRMFADSVDPDAVIDAVTHSVGREKERDYSQDKLLSQFLSQILGAIRSALTLTGTQPESQTHSQTRTQAFPHLLWPTQDCLVQLVSKGYVRDKLVAKRLCRSLFAYCEENALKESVVKSLRVSSSLSERLSLDEHLSTLRCLTQLCVLGNRSYTLTQTDVHTDISVADTLAQSFAPYMAGIVCVAREVLADTLRLLFAHDDTNSVHNTDDSHNVETDIGGSVLGEFSPLRGGWLYSPSIAIAEALPALLQTAMPCATLLLLHTQKYAHSDVQLLLSFASVLLSFLSLSHAHTAPLPRWHTRDLCLSLLRLLKTFVLSPTLSASVSLCDWITLTQRLAAMPAHCWERETDAHALELVSHLSKCVHSHTSTNNENETESESERLACALWLLWCRRSSSLLSLSDNTHALTQRDNDCNDMLAEKALESFVHILPLQPRTGDVTDSDYALLTMRHTLRLLRNLVRPLSLSVSLSTEECVSRANSAMDVVLEYLMLSSPSSISAERDTVLRDECSRWADSLSSTQAFENAFNACVKLSALITSPNMVPSCEPFIVAIARARSQDKTLYHTLVQTLANRTLSPPTDTETQSAKDVLISSLRDCLLAFALHTITLSGTDFEERVVCVRVYLQFFQFFFAQNATSVEPFLAQTLPLLCRSIHQFEREDAHVSLCGKALTLIARQSSDAFRAQLPALSEADKLVLQHAMKIALQAEQQQAHAQQARGPLSAGSAGIKAINLDKYRK